MSGAKPAFGEADLLAYADRKLPPEREREVEAWLALPENAGARERLDRWMAQATLLRAALAPVADEPVPARLRAVLGDAPKQRRWLMPAAGFAAAIVLGVALGVGGGWALWGSTPPAARHLATAGLSAHEVFIQENRHAVEVAAADEPHLVNWLSNRLDLPLTPPDLTGSGLSLLGGRVVPEDGRPAAQLMYEDASGQRFTLFIARSLEPLTTAFRYMEGATSGAYYWMDGTVGYVFAGPDDRDVLLRLSQTVFDQMI